MVLRLAPGSGATTLVTNLGVAMAQDKQRLVAIADMDLEAQGQLLGALDTGKDHLFLERNAQLFIGRQQLGIDIVPVDHAIFALLDLARSDLTQEGLLTQAQQRGFMLREP